MPTIVRLDPAPAGRVAVRFPFDRSLVDRLKEIPGLHWDQYQHAWSCSRDAVPAVGQAVGEKFMRNYISPRQDGFDVPELGLYDFQKADVQFLRARPDGAILGSKPGVGKTLPAIAWAQSIGGRTLIVAPSAARSVWRSELRRIGLPALAECTGTKHRELVEVALGGVEKVVELKNYAWVSCHYEILDAWASTLLQSDFENLICDEVQFVINRAALRTKALFRLSEHAKNRIALSGTLIRTGPKNLWTVCEIVRPGIFGGHWGSGRHEGSYVGYWKYAERYCGYSGPTENEAGIKVYDDTGSSNEPELAARLKDLVLTRTREEVKKELPVYSRQLLEIDLNTRQTLAYKKAAAKLLPLAEANPSQAQEVLDSLLETVDGFKLAQASDLADEAVNAGEKVIIFTHFHKSLKALSNMYEDMNDNWTMKIKPYVFLAGGWEARSQRDGQYQAFRDFNGGAILLANTLSTGIAINLSCATRLIFTTLEWTVADLIQAESRPLRDGLKSPLLIQYLLSPGTIDLHMATALFSRAAVEKILLGVDPQAESLAKDFDSAGYVDHSTVKPVGPRPKEVVQAALSSMLAAFKRAKLLAGDEEWLVGGAETDELLDEDGEKYAL